MRALIAVLSNLVIIALAWWVWHRLRTPTYEAEVTCNVGYYHPRCGHLITDRYPCPLHATADDWRQIIAIAEEHICPGGDT